MKTKFEIFKEMIELSHDENRGLTVYFDGQVVVGIVVKLIEEQAIELRNREFSGILVLIEAISAIAIG